MSRLPLRLSETSRRAKDTVRLAGGSPAAKIMDDLLQTGGKWALTRVTAGHIARQQRLTAARRARPKSLNDAELERYGKAILSAISD
jgi:hypothetical protein